jgi:4-hydroxy-tetrahydrodipicolinate synthase
MCRAALAGRREEALELHFRLLPLMLAIFVESSPIPVKAALEIMGRSPAHHRLPMVGLMAENLPLLEEALRAAGAIGNDG